MRRIDPYTLKLLVSVAQARSIARAAVKEHIAPSALSRRIADLEQALRVPLLVRSPTGISLTEAGAVAVRRASGIQENLQLLVRDVQRHAGRIAGTVRLHASPAAIVGHLPERLKAFIDEHRDVRVTLQESHAEELMRACMDGRADVGVGECMAAPGTIESRYFAHDPLVVELPADHPLEKKSRLRLADVLAYPQVIVHPGGHIDNLIRKHAVLRNLTVKDSVAVGSYDAGCRMVEAGFGLAVKPKRAAEIFASKLRLVTRPLKESWAGNEQNVYSLRQTPRPPAVSALIEALSR